MKRKSLAVLIAMIVASIFLLAGFASAAPSTQTYKFRLQHWQPTSSATYKLFVSDKGFPAMVERASGGRIKIETYSVGSVVPVTDQLRAVGKGVIDMAAGCGAYYAGLGNYFSLLYGIPFTLDSMEDVEIVWRDLGLLAYARELYGKYNAYCIGWHHESPIAIFSKKQIKTLGDFKGLKIRAVGAYADFYNMLGASSLSTPGSEIYLALDRGVVDACTWGSESAMIEIGLQEVTKHIILPWISGGATGDMLINMDKWKALPDDLKQIMTSCMEDWANVTGSYYRYHSLLDRSMAVEKYHMTLNFLSEADIIKAKKLSLQLLDKYAARNPESAKIIKIYKDYFNLKKSN